MIETKVRLPKNYVREFAVQVTLYEATVQDTLIYSQAHRKEHVLLEDNTSSI